VTKVTDPSRPRRYSDDEITHRIGALHMTVDNIVHVVAGTFVLLSLALGVEGSPLFVNANFLWFTAFVGANLLQSGITKWCLMASILRKLGVPESRKQVLVRG